MPVVWESTFCKAAGGANSFKTKHLHITAEKPQAEKCRQWAEVIFAARSQYRNTPPGIADGDFMALKRAVGGVVPPVNGLLCITLAELQKLEALIIERKGKGKIFQVPNGFIIMTSKNFDKCWEGYGGEIDIEIEIKDDTYQVWHCNGMTSPNKAVPEW